MSVIAALREHHVPLLLAASLAAMAVYAIILPCNCAAAPIDAEEPTMKYTLQGCAPFFRTTSAAAATVNVVVILKMNCLLVFAPASSVRVDDKATADDGKV